MSDIRIIIATHKSAVFPSDPHILPLQAGRSSSEADLGITGDNTGENISEKNRQYGELTALYWAWKNLSPDVIGLFHYRRYLWLDHPFTLTRNLVNDKSENKDLYFPRQELITRNLADTDLLLPRPNSYPWSLEVDYRLNHITEDLDIITDIIAGKHSEYLLTWIRLMKFNNRLPHYNMFIARFPLFSDYCSWLFPVLEEAEKRIKPSPYRYQQRVFGFLAERLFLLWCEKNNIRRKYFPVVFLTENEPQTDHLYTVKRISRKFSFLSGNPRALAPQYFSEVYLRENFRK
jgi:hypothetical protein